MMTLYRGAANFWLASYEQQRLFAARFNTSNRRAVLNGCIRSFSLAKKYFQDLSPDSAMGIARKPGYADPLAGNTLGFEINMPQYWGATQLKNLAKQYDLSPYEMRVVQERAHKRWTHKKEYQRLAYNPYRTMQKEAGIPFDPAIQRFTSVRADLEPYFTPTYKNFLFFVVVSFAPPIILWVIAMHYMIPYHEAIERGEVPYRERMGMPV